MGSQGISYKTFVGAVIAVSLVAVMISMQLPTSQNHDRAPTPVCPQPEAHQTSLQPVQFMNRKGEHIYGQLADHVTIGELNVTTTYMEDGKQQTMNIYMMGTTTTPPFIAVLGLPKLDSASMDAYKNGDMEIPTRLLFQYLLQESCGREKGKKMMVDAGANLGYFATYAAVMGCSVHAFEPQPRLQPIIRTSAIMNAVDTRFTLHNNIISENSADRLKIKYSKSNCWGCSVVSPASRDEVSSDGSYIIDSVRIDSWVDQDVELLKVDVEGYEVKAIESALELIVKHTVKNIVVEWSAKRWPHDLQRGTQLLEKLYDMGYTIRHYNLRFHLPIEMIKDQKSIDYPLIGPTWEVPRDQLGPMNEFLKSTTLYGEANLWLAKER